MVKTTFLIDYFSNYPSSVHVWTDADDKDSHKADVVKALAISKSASIRFILTGACDGFGRRKKRAICECKMHSFFSHSEKLKELGQEEK